MSAIGVNRGHPPVLVHHRNSSLYCLTVHHHDHKLPSCTTKPFASLFLYSSLAANSFSIQFSSSSIRCETFCFLCGSHLDGATDATLFRTVAGSEVVLRKNERITTSLTQLTLTYYYLSLVRSVSAQCANTAFSHLRPRAPIVHSCRCSSPTSLFSLFHL
jgi:hypothetical protein